MIKNYKSSHVLVSFFTMFVFASCSNEDGGSSTNADIENISDSDSEDTGLDLDSGEESDSDDSDSSEDFDFDEDSDSSEDFDSDEDSDSSEDFDSGEDSDSSEDSDSEDIEQDTLDETDTNFDSGEDDVILSDSVEEWENHCGSLINVLCTHLYDPVCIEAQNSEIDRKREMFEGLYGFSGEEECLVRMRTSCSLDRISIEEGRILIDLLAMEECIEIFSNFDCVTYLTLDHEVCAQRFYPQQQRNESCGLDDDCQIDDFCNDALINFNPIDGYSIETEGICIERYDLNSLCRHDVECKEEFHCLPINEDENTCQIEEEE